MTAPDTVTDPDLQEVEWDLSHLLDGAGDDPQAAVDALLADAQERADAFAAAYAGKVGSLDGAGLIAAMQELATIEEIAGRAGTYVHLAFSVDTADPAIGALMQRVEEKGTAIETKLLFFHLEWAALDDAVAERLLATDGLDFARHHLATARRYRPHLLSEPEERILTEKSVSGRSAWVRLFEEQTAAISVDLPDASEPVSLEVALARLFETDREIRRDTAERVTEGAGAGPAHARLHVQHAAGRQDDRRPAALLPALARLAQPLQRGLRRVGRGARFEAVRGRFEIARRWYRLKAQLLGIDKLADYDRMAAVTQDNEKVPWPEAKRLVLDAYSSFSPELGGLVSRFYDEKWIDGPVRPGKRGGAFCSYGVPSVHPYVMLNYTYLRRDVLTLAHELGHGVHAALGSKQGIFHMATPLTLAETASVFGETLVFGRLLEAAPTPESRLSLLAESIEGSIATVFRQVAMNRFEHFVHTSRRDEGELSIDRIGELWAQSQDEMLGDSVEVTEGYRTWWSYVPHFIASPGYVYAYAYGQLLALAVYGRYEEEGPEFASSYIELLSAGGSRSPEELGAIVGVDLADPGFWDKGLDLVERKLDAAEQAAREAGRLS